MLDGLSHCKGSGLDRSKRFAYAPRAMGFGTNSPRLSQHALGRSVIHVAYIDIGRSLASPKPFLKKAHLSTKKEKEAVVLWLR